MSIKKHIIVCLVICVLLSGSAFSSLASSVEVNGKAVSNNDVVVGAPSQKVWTFKANKKGTFSLKFSYARPWEKGTPAIKTTVYTLKVIDGKNSVGTIAELKENTTNIVKVGQEFSIALQENPSTGYSWSYNTDKRAIKLINTKNIEEQEQPTTNSSDVLKG